MDQIKICDKMIENPKHEILVRALDDISSGKGVFYHNEHTHERVESEELCVTGQCLNQSLLVVTLAQRIAAGDIELVEKGDTIGKKAYFEKLLKSVENDFNT